jgi:hypothetical protein
MRSARARPTDRSGCLEELFLGARSDRAPKPRLERGPSGAAKSNSSPASSVLDFAGARSDEGMRRSSPPDLAPVRSRASMTRRSDGRPSRRAHRRYRPKARAVPLLTAPARLDRGALRPDLGRSARTCAAHSGGCDKRIGGGADRAQRRRGSSGAMSRSIRRAAGPRRSVRSRSDRPIERAGLAHG